MPKIKTHKSTAKVFKKRKNDYKIGKPGSRHNTGKKSSNFNRSCRKGSTLSSSDKKRLKNLI
ncbi:MAG: 50S ribosomal protein L35 [Bacilli bacterium]|nr:50S ribosomal protein L35 [Bacilli bacterium]